jgi:AbrB family looped-hinge helix DNA binding protein
MVASRRVRLSSKGQLVIPQEMRETLGLQAGDELILHLVSDRAFVAEVSEPSPFEQAAARLRQQARERGITREDVERELRDVRREAYRARQAARSAR